MKKSNELIIISLYLLVIPTSAYAHTPLVSVVVLGGFLFLPGVIASLLAAKETKLIWFLGAIVLTVMCMWVMSKELDYIPFFLVAALPFLLIPAAIWDKKRRNKGIL